jgi:Concanavalin A-like lectin/glucanases superfamily
MDGTNGSTTFTDSSSNNFAVTANGNVQISSAQSKFGGASALFDGNGDYLQLPVNAIQFNANDFTIEFWVYPTRTGSHTCVANWGCGSNMTIFFAVETSQGVVVYLNGTGPYIQGGSIQVNQWQHVALVRQGSNMKAYINGVQAGDTYNIGNGAINTIVDNIRIGRDTSSFNCNTPLEGYLDDLRITTGLARYTANFTPSTQQLPDPSDPLSLLLHMDGTNGSQSFVDSSNNNFTITANGNAQISDVEKKFGNGAAYFDGYGDYLELPSDSAFAFGTEDFTVEMWLYPTQMINDYHVFFDTRPSNGSLGEAITMFLKSNQTLHLLIVSENDIVSDPLTPDQWTHVALVRTGNDFKLYLNGTQSGNTFNNSGSINEPYLVIGKTVEDTINFYNGYIDELRITKGVAIYTANFTPGPLDNKFRFLRGQSASEKIRFLPERIRSLSVFNLVNGVDTNITAIACYAANEDCLNGLDDCISSAFDCLYDKTQCENDCNNIEGDDNNEAYDSCIENCSSEYQCNDIEYQCYIDYDCGFDLADCLSQYNNQTVVTLNSSVFNGDEDYYLRLSNGLGVEQIIFQGLGGDNYTSLDLILSNQMPLLQSLSFVGCGYDTFTITAPNGTNVTALNFSACGDGISFIFNPTAGLANISSLNITNSNSSYNFTISDISVMTNLSTFTLNGDIIADAVDRHFYIGGMSTPMHADKVLMVLQAVYNSTVENTFWVYEWNACQYEYDGCVDDYNDCMDLVEICYADHFSCVDYAEGECFYDECDGEQPCYYCDHLCDSFEGGAVCDSQEEACGNCDNVIEDCQDNTNRYSSSYLIELKVLNSTYTGAVVGSIQNYRGYLELDRNLTVNLTFV